MTDSSMSDAPEIGRSLRDRHPTKLNRDVRIIEEFAFRYPNGGNSKDFIAAAQATGYPFKGESTIRTIQSILIGDGLLLKDGRNQFRAPPDVVSRVLAGQRTPPIVPRLSRSEVWEQRRERIRAELHRIYPPPVRFGALDVFEKFPELRTIKNADAYLRYFEKRSEVVSFGDGLFGFKPAEIDRDREAARLTAEFDRVQKLLASPPIKPGTFLVARPEYVAAVYGIALEPPFPSCLVMGRFDSAGVQYTSVSEIDVMWFDPRTGYVQIKTKQPWMFEEFDPSSIKRE